MTTILPNSFMDEAIMALGYVEPDRSSELAKFLAQWGGHHPRAVALAFRKVGDQLGPDEKRALGLRRNAFFSEKALECLTERGRSNPVHALEVTFLRAALSEFRHRSLQSARDPMFHGCKISGTFSDCPGCERLDGLKTSPDEAAAMLPPSDCSREACAITVTPYIDWLRNID